MKTFEFTDPEWADTGVTKLEMCKDACTNTEGCRSVMWNDCENRCDMMDIELTGENKWKLKSCTTTYFQMKIGEKMFMNNTPRLKNKISQCAISIS